ncbi:MAG: hypothetical protein IPK50_03200 [Fibrobacterota bacterium]|nr:hypothetical protein [Fibrobacterota bacterium]QQS05903.1 MAG: hypothetical protein IPK50_03200 [Fibrobacterota bacterium]
MRRGGILLAAALSACGLDRDAGGSTSETSNGLQVQVVRADGRPAARTRVRIRPADYLADEWTRMDASKGIIDTVTDDSGCVRLRRPGGDLRIEALGATGQAQAHLDSSASIVNFRLAPPARLSGSVRLEPTDTRARIQVRGMERGIWTDSLGRFQLDSLPSGRIEVRASIVSRGAASEFLSALHPGESDSVAGIQASIEHPIWTDSVTILVDTRALPGLTSPVDSVPVLLRLSDTLFPANARMRGQDIRVVDSAGNAVPFFLEAFSREGRFALIRTFLPRTHPSRVAVALRVRWGDPLAESVASPGGVFSERFGWVGAWNLDRTYADPQGRLRAADASFFRDDAVLTGSPASDPEGGLRFSRSGTTGFAAAGDQVDFDHSFTVIWRLKPQERGQTFLGWGDSVWRSGKKDFYLQQPKVNVRQAGWNPAFTARADTGYNVYSISDKSVDSARWTILCARLDLSNTDSAAVQWFMDGTPTGQAATARLRYQGDLPRDSLVVGWRHTDSRRFTGSLSDILILRRAVSDDWIRLYSALLANPAGLVRLSR